MSGSKLNYREQESMLNNNILIFVHHRVLESDLLFLKVHRPMCARIFRQRASAGKLSDLQCRFPVKKLESAFWNLQSISQQITSTVELQPSNKALVAFHWKLNHRRTGRPNRNQQREDVSVCKRRVRWTRLVQGVPVEQLSRLNWHQKWNQKRNLKWRPNRERELFEFETSERNKKSDALK